MSPAHPPAPPPPHGGEILFPWPDLAEQAGRLSLRLHLPDWRDAAADQAMLACGAAMRLTWPEPPAPAPASCPHSLARALAMVGRRGQGAFRLS